MSVVFVSYRSIDEFRVVRIAESLKACGHEVVYDKTMGPGDQYYLTLPSLIDTSDYFLYCPSSDGQDTQPMKDELGWAGGFRWARKGRPLNLVPVLFDGGVTPDPLIGFWRVSFTGNGDQAIEQLKEKLGCRELESPPDATERSSAASLTSHDAYMSALRLQCAPPDVRHQSHRAAFVTPRVLPMTATATHVLPSVEPLLEPGARSLVLGESGSGKSSTLQWLAREHAIAGPKEPDAVSHLPILLPLRRLMLTAPLGGVRTLASHVRDWLDIATDEQTFGEWLRTFFETGNVLLLVDGLDGFEVRGSLSDVVQWLDAILRTYPRTRLIASARENSAALVDLNFSVYRLAPLIEHDQRALWDAFAPPARSIDFTRPRTPLDLKTFAFAAASVDATATRADIERAALTSLIERGAVAGEPYVDQLRSELAYVALRLYVYGVHTAGIRDLCSWLDEFRRSGAWRGFPADQGSAGSLACLLRRGSVIQIAPPTRSDPTGVRFTHDHYRDYLAAEAIVQGWVPPSPGAATESARWEIFDLLRDYRSLHRWRDVLRFWLLLHPDPETAADALTTIYDTGLRESGAPGAEIAMSAVLDDMVATDAHAAILRAFVWAVAMNWGAGQEPPAETTFRRVATHPAWSEQFLGVLSASHLELIGIQGVEPMALDLVRRWVTDARSAPRSTAPS